MFRVSRIVRTGSIYKNKRDILSCDKWNVTFNMDFRDFRITIQGIHDFKGQFRMRLDQITATVIDFSHKMVSIVVLDFCNGCSAGFLLCRHKFLAEKRVD